MSDDNKQLSASLSENEVALSEFKKQDAELVIQLEEKSGVLIAAKQAIDERDKIIEAKVQRQSALELELATLNEQHQLLSDSRDTLAKALDEVKQSSEKLSSELAALKEKLKATEAGLGAEQPATP